MLEAEPQSKSFKRWQWDVKNCMTDIIKNTGLVVKSRNQCTTDKKNGHVRTRFVAGSVPTRISCKRRLDRMQSLQTEAQWLTLLQLVLPGGFKD